MTEQEVLFDLFRMADLGVLDKFELAAKEQMTKSEEYFGLVRAIIFSKTKEGFDFWHKVACELY